MLPGDKICRWQQKAEYDIWEISDMNWILLVLIYGLAKGFREVLKKKALEKSSALEVLIIYTLISFILVMPEIRNAGGISPSVMLLIAVKSFVIFIAWMAGFTAIKYISVGLYGLLDQSRLVFATLMGVVVLRETMGAWQVCGLVLVILGIVLLKFAPKKDTPAPVSDNGAGSDNTAVSPAAPVSSKSWFFILLTLVSAFLNAVSGTLDKILLRGDDLTDGQLQFWYMLFLALFYVLYALIKKPGLQIKKAIRNPWIWMLSVLFVVADRCLFMANADPASKVTVMTLIKQSCCIITIIGGRIVFKEKGLGYKLICALIIITGILLAVLI